MRKLSKSTKIVATVAAAAAVIAGSGAAYAYWTTTGTGSGTVTATTNVAITAVQTGTITNLAPGVAPQTLSGTFTNTNPYLVRVATVTAALGTPTGGSGGCLASDFTLTGATMTVNAEIPTGTSQGAWTGATIQFNDLAGVSQDRCKGASVPITYTIN